VALRQHHAHLVLQTEDGAEHVGVEGRRIGLGRLFGQRSRLPFGTSVVDGDIQAAKALDGLVDEIAHVVLVADIRTHELRFGTQSAQFSDQCLPGIVASTGNYDARTFLSEREGGRAADAGKRVRDEYDWVGVHVLCPSSD
jgi:hypothetical protein